MTAIQNAAAARLKAGDKTACGWTLLAIYQGQRDPWPWCLVGRGEARGRLSPRQFSEARA